MKSFLSFLILTMFFLGNSAQEKNSFKDPRDGKVYKTVKIGDQTWFAENLAFKADFGCWAYDNDESNVKKFGRLYTYGTAKRVCPPGWHLPTKTEFDILLQQIGGIGNHAYNQLLPSGKSGFCALLGGIRMNDKFFYIGSIGHFWSTTEINSVNAWYLGITNFVLDAGLCDPNRLKKINNKTHAFSIRCIKD